MADLTSGAGLNSPSPNRVNINLPGQGEAPLSDIRKTFRSGYVFELQDLRQPQKPVMVHVLALNPVRYTLSEPFQSVLTPTENNTVVAEENGQIIRELTIEGTTGLSDKRGLAFEGDQGPMSGTEHFLHLRNMFRRYGRIKQSPRDAAHIRMVFHSLRDDDHFVVVPRSFETPRDARTTRMHYEYRISLAVIADADNTLVSLDLKNGFDLLTDGLGAVAGFFNDARAGFAEVTAKLSKIQRKLGNVNSTMLQAAGLINSIGNAFRAVGNLVAYPLLLVPSVLETIDSTQDQLVNSISDATIGTEAEAARSLRRMSQALDAIAAEPAFFGPSPITNVALAYEGDAAATASDIERGEAGATEGTRTRNAVGSGRDAGLDLGDYGGVIRHDLVRTDSITGLAARFRVPPELIILINDLRFPYIIEGGGPGLLTAGDVILIPVEGSAGGLQPSGENLTADEALYGIDIALDPTLLRQNKMDIRAHNSRLDYDLSRGLKNVIQGTEITLRTDRGSTAFVPEVGIRRSVGVKGTIQHLVMTALHLREGILADSRVEGIQDSTVILDGDVLTQEISPKLIGQGSVTVVMPVGRASGTGGSRSFSGG